MAHLDGHKLLSDKQHAFRKWHSCETRLTTVIDDLKKKILDNQGQVDTFILDFEKTLTLTRMNFLKANCLGTCIELEGKIEMDRCFSALDSASYFGACKLGLGIEKVQHVQLGL